MPYAPTELTRFHDTADAAAAPAPQAKAAPLLAAAPAVALFFLAPFYAELLSGSTPPLLYFQPFTLFFMHATYGALAVLLREWAVRRHIGLWGRVVLALAVGLYIEGVVCKSLYSPHWPDFSFPEGWGRLWGVNWPWTVNLLIYHGLNSFLVPWLAVDLLLPRYRAAPSLRRRGMIGMAVLLILSGLVGLHGFGMSPGGPVYIPGRLARAIAWLGPLAIAWVATLVREPSGRGLRPPSPRLLGWLTGLGWLMFFVVQGLGDGGMRPPLLAIAIALAEVALLLSLGWAWRGRLTELHRCALVAGNTWFWAVVAVLEAFGVIPNPDPTRGMSIVAIAALAGLFMLRRMIRLRTPGQSPPATANLSP